MPVYEVLQKIAFEKRVKIHDLALEGTDAVVAPASLSVGRKSWDRDGRKSWDREDTVNIQGSLGGELVGICTCQDAACLG